MLQIATEKVAHIIIRAREYDAKVAPWDDDRPDEREDDVGSILEATADDPIAAELKSFIDNLNDDEQTSLVALMWVGRGTYEADDFAEALEMARSERVNATSDYLLGVPLLADYLDEGLEKLGYSAADSESDIM